MGSVFDLNADLGEGCGTDAELIGLISSANIACGGHAGNRMTMRGTVQLARAAGVRIGAHPGFVDKQNFGRKRLRVAPPVLVRQVLTQIEELQEITNEEGVPLTYVKLHGALANMTAEDEVLARTLFAAINARFPELEILALDNSAQTRAASLLNIPFIREAYADRAYNDDGTLVSRSAPGAVLKDADAVVDQCLRLAQHGEIVAQSGKVLKSEARSICVHGDTPGAVALAARIVQVFGEQGISVRSG